MQVTVAEYAHMRGVSVGTIEWMVTDPAQRPACPGYVAEPPPEVFCSARRYAALLGCDLNAVRYRLRRGTLERNVHGRLGVHDSDLRWGLRYFDLADNYSRRSDIGPLSDNADAARSTCFLQAVERELIRLGHLKPEGLVEAQLECTARSPDWLRRNRGSRGICRDHTVFAAAL